MKRTRRGLTLLEIVVAMVILGILLAIGIPAFSRYKGNVAVRAEADKLEQMLRLARSAAKAGSISHRPGERDLMARLIVVQPRRDTGGAEGEGGDTGGFAGVQADTQAGGNDAGAGAEYRVSSRVTGQETGNRRVPLDHSIVFRVTGMLAAAPVVNNGALFSIADGGEQAHLAIEPNGQLSVLHGNNPVTIEMFGAGRVNIVFTISPSGDISRR